MTSRAHPRHRAVDVLGRRGWPRPSSRTPTSRRSSASTARRRRSSSSAPSSCAGRRHPLAHPPHRRGRRDRHRRRHAPRRRLGRHDAAARPREQRHRHDERPGRVRRRRLARPQGRLPLERPLLRRRAGRPGLLHRGHAPRRHPPRTPIERDIVEAEGAVADFAPRNPDIDRDRPALRQRRSGPDVRTSHMTLLGLPVVPTILGFDPRFQFIHEDDIAGCAPARRAPRPAGAFNCAADGVLALGEVARPARQAARAGPAAVGDRAGRRRAQPRGRPHAARAARPAALRPRARQPPAEGDGLPLPLTTRETVLELRRASAPGPASAQDRAATATSARSRSSCASARACGARAPRRAARGLLAGARRRGAGRQPPAGAALGGIGFDDLPAADLLALLPSLPAGDLAALARARARPRGPPEVLTAIERLLRAKA